MRRESWKKMGGFSKEEVLGRLVEDVWALLEELCQSGFDAVHDSTLEGIREMAQLSGQFGMEYLGVLLGELAEGLDMRRHRLGRKRDGLAGVYARLNEYLYLCEEKVIYDDGWKYYANKVSQDGGWRSVFSIDGEPE